MTRDPTSNAAVQVRHKLLQGLVVLVTFVPNAGAIEYSFGLSDQFAFGTSHGSARFEYSTGDALIARVNESLSIGGITGSRDAQITPQIGPIPEIRGDTRTGLKLTAGVDAYAGVELFGGFEFGGSNISGNYAFGPRLSLPDQVRAGEFFAPRGQTIIGTADLDLDVGLPTFDLGMDVRLGGSANGKLEYGLFPFVPYDIGHFNLNFPSIDLPVFDFNVDLNLPKLPDFGFLPDIPSLHIPNLTSGNDGAFLRKKLPAIDPLKPGAPPLLLSAGEVVLWNPSESVASPARIENGAIVTRKKGDLLGIALDLDGLATFATTGVSFSGLEIDIKPGSVPLATLGYDLIDVKYGFEVGYEIESRVDTFLEVDIAFLDSNGDAVSVLQRYGDAVTTGTHFSGRFDQLPELALLSDSDVTLDIDFTGLKRQLNQKGSLTFSDYMELRALAARASVLGGVASVELGPVFYKKFELAGQLAGLDIYDVSLTLSDLGFADDLFDGTATIEAIPSQLAYLASPFATIGSSLHPSGFRLLSNGASATSADTTDLVLAIAGATGTSSTKLDLTAKNVSITGDISDRGIAGLYLAEDSRLNAGLVSPVDVSFRLGSIENDGYVTSKPNASASHSNLLFKSTTPDGVLRITGNGEINFGGTGGIEAGIIIHGKNHTLTYSSGSSAPLPTPGSRVLTAQFQLSNEGTIQVRGNNLLAILTPNFENHDGALLSARQGSEIAMRSAGHQVPFRFGNQGVVEANGTGARLNIAASTLDGVFASVFNPTAERGVFQSINGGRADFWDGKAERSGDPDGLQLVLQNRLRFLTGVASSTTFHAEVEVDGDVLFETEAGGWLTLNGLQRTQEDAQVEIINAGLLELKSGVTSLRPPGGVSCPGCPPPVPAIKPVDLSNSGTVRVRAGAGFAFDVDIVDYAAGGASLDAGTWELFGNTKIFANTDTVSIADRRGDVAIIDVRVNEVFGNAGRFEDYAFDEVLDANGDVVAVGSDISQLDTRLVYNDGTVRLHGAAKFDYFNTVAVNRGTLEIAKGHQFYSDGTLHNRGGTLNVDQAGGLHVAGALIIDGGEVSIGRHPSTELTSNSFLTVEGAQLKQIDGTSALLHVEINGGTLHLGPHADLSGETGIPGLGGPPGNGLMEASGHGGFALISGRSWVIRDALETLDNGNEVITAGTVVLETRGGVLTGDANAGVAEIHANHAEVTLSGANARFGGLEYLSENSGSLTLLGGATLTRLDSAAVAGNDFTNYLSGKLDINSGRLVFGGDNSRLANAGDITVGQNAYLATDEITALGTLKGTIDTAGHLSVANGLAASALTLRGGILATPAIDLNGRKGRDGAVSAFATELTRHGDDGTDGGLLHLLGGAIGSASISGIGGSGGNGLDARGGHGGRGGRGSELVIDGGLLLVDGDVDLRGGRGGDGGNEDFPFSEPQGGNGGRGGDGGSITLRDGALVLAGGQIDLRAGRGGERGVGGTFDVGFLGFTVTVADGTRGAFGEHGDLRLAGGTLTSTAARLDNDIRGNVVYDAGTLHFTDDLFELGHSSARLNALLGGADKTLGAGKTLAFDHVLRIGAGESLALAGGVLVAGEIDHGADDWMLIDGTLSAGTLNANLVQHGGRLAPGLSPGLMTIAGDYAIDGGIVEIELAGSTRGDEYDALDVSGTATLGGTLMISLLDAFVPAPGDSFQILAADTISGAFQTLLFDALAENLIWKLDYDLDVSGMDFLTLTATSVPLPPALWLCSGALLFLMRRRGETITAARAAS